MIKEQIKKAVEDIYRKLLEQDKTLEEQEKKINKLGRDIRKLKV